MEKEILKKLHEDTIGPNAPDVATIDEIVNIGKLFQLTTIPSLGKSIFPILPLHGPTGALFGIRNKADKSGFELIRKNFEVFPSVTINTKITKEVISDIYNQFGEDGVKITIKFLRGLANEQENIKTIEFLNANCLPVNNLTLSMLKNAETVVFEVTKYVNELIARANIPTFKTISGFSVLPYKVGAAFAAINSMFRDNRNQSALFLHEIGNVKYFLNPDVNTNTAYVGLLDFEEPIKSAGIFSPFKTDIFTATDPDSGQEVYFIYNRFAITASPFHEPGTEMMFKFDIL